MKTNLITAALLLVALSTASNAHGSVISADDPKFGFGSFTIDTATGLEWLDLSQTFDKSINSIIADSGVGGTYAGLRFATKDEVVRLYSDAGLNIVTILSNQGDTVNTASANSGYYANRLIGLLGGSTDPIENSIFGITGTLVTGDNRGYNYFGSEIATGYDGLIGQGYTGSPVDDRYFIATYHSSRVGDFLVREQSPTPTPEPATLLMIASGLAGIWFARVRNKTI